ncbi:MAG: RHS repeat domain-containing protein, partial [Candidatus Brocadiia bacterium]
GDTVAKYTYDASSRRRTKQIPGPGNSAPSTITFIYDGWKVLEERDGDGNILSEYTQGLYIDEYVTIETGGKRAYYHQDTIYNVKALTDEKGRVIERYAYTAYGEPSVLNKNGMPVPRSKVGNRYLFQGRRLDEESALYYFRHRMMSGKLGRFLQRDPVGYVGSTNLHLGFLGAPIVRKDPLGLQTQRDTGETTITINGVAVPIRRPPRYKCRKHRGREPDTTSHTAAEQGKGEKNGSSSLGLSQSEALHFGYTYWGTGNPLLDYDLTQKDLEELGEISDNPVAVAKFLDNKSPMPNPYDIYEELDQSALPPLSDSSADEPFDIRLHGDNIFRLPSASDALPPKEDEQEVPEWRMRDALKRRIRILTCVRAYNKHNSHVAECRLAVKSTGQGEDEACKDCWGPRWCYVDRPEQGCLGPPPDRCYPLYAR